MKRELLACRATDGFSRKRPSLMNDRHSIYLQKNIVDFQIVQQNCLDLEAEKSCMEKKIQKL